MRDKKKLQEKHGIKIGQICTIWKSTEEKKIGRKSWRSRRVRILDVYQHFALTETPAGVRECFLWQELKTKMEGPNDRRK